MKRCSRCILPENYPGITFDKDGVCNYCRNFEEPVYLGDDEFIKFVRSHRRPGQEFDCLLGISGGRDSSYLVYYLVKKLNLKVLGYFFDQWYIPEETKANIDRLVKMLDLNLITEQSNLLKTCVKHHLISWFKRPSPAMIGMVCTGCRLGTDQGLIRTARRYNVPFLIYGGHPLEGSGFKLNLLKKNPHSRLGNLAVLGGYIREIARNPSWIMNHRCLMTQVKEYTFHFSPIRRLTEKLKYTKLTSSSPFYRFIPWNEQEVVSTIERELGWKNPDYGESTWRTDCKISILKNYMYYKTLGFSDKDDGLSCLIRAGQITRAEGLERLAKENAFSEDFITRFLEEEGLSFEQLQQALDSALEPFKR